MASYNRVVLVGNLTRDVELKYVGDGKAVANFGLAVNEKYKDKEETTFVDLTAWGRTAEIISEYTSKGSQLMIEGRLKLDQWEQDGVKRSKLKVVVDKAILLGGKHAPVPTPTSGAEHTPAVDDEAPF